MSDYSFWSFLPLDEITNDSIFYNFGGGEDFLFEFNLSGNKNPFIYIFDPTPRSIQHMEFCKNIIKTGIVPPYNKRYGHGFLTYNDEIKKTNANIDKIKFYPFGLYNKNGTSKFYLPQNPEHVSLSIDNIQNTKDYIELNVKTIDTITNKLGHKNIDFLKMNIEGAEVESLIYMINKTHIRPKYISVVFELPGDRQRNFTDKTSQCINILKQDYTIIYNKMNNFTFKLSN